MTSEAGQPFKAALADARSRVNGRLAELAEQERGGGTGGCSCSKWPASSTLKIARSFSTVPSEDFTRARRDCTPRCSASR